MNGSKRGIVSVFLVFFAFLIIIILLFVSISFITVNIAKSKISADINYAVTNSITTYNKDYLYLSCYKVDNLDLKNNMQMLLDKNYSNSEGLINTVNIKSVKAVFSEKDILNYDEKYPFVEVIVSFKIKRISNIIKKDYTVEVKQNVKLALLNYKE